MHTIADFYTASEKYSALLNTFAEKHCLVGHAQTDHICFKCASGESFEKMRAMFEGESGYIYQSIISQRRIAIIRLRRGIKTSLGMIHFLELSDQKPDGSQREGLDHIEIYPVGRSYDEMVHALAATERVTEVVRPHHTTHDIDIGDGLLIRCTHEPLIEKIKHSEMRTA